MRQDAVMFLSGALSSCPLAGNVGGALWVFMGRTPCCVLPTEVQCPPQLGWKQHPASSASKSGPHSLSGTEDADRRVSSRNRCGSTAPVMLGKTLGDVALPDSRIVVHVCRDLPT